MDNTTDVTMTGEGTNNYLGRSVDGTGDVNNDLITDIYITQIAARAAGRATKINLRPMSNYCDDLSDSKEKEK